MRRLLSIVLLCLFSAPLISPLFALTSLSDTHLPACCRRAGAHHCAASMQMESQSTGITLASRTDRCPAYPQPSTPIPHTDLAAPTEAHLIADSISHPASPRQSQARARVALDRSRHKRGPPSSLL